MTPIKARALLLNFLVSGALVTLMLSPKISVVLLTFATVALILTAAGIGPQFKQHRAVLFLLLAFALWILFSAVAISGFEREALPLLKVVLLLLLGALSIAFFSAEIAQRLRSSIDDKPFSYAYLISVFILFCAYAYASVTDSAPWGSYYFDPFTTLNGNAVLLSLVIWQIFYLQIEKPTIVRGGMIVGAVVFVSLSASSASLVAIIVGVCVMLFRRFAGRAGGVAMALVAALLIFTAPYVISASGAEKYMEPSVVNDTSLDIPYSARHRLAMWAFATEKIYEKPWLGWGFDSSRYIPQEDHRLAPNMEIMPLHPHNLALQTRLELGLPGILILSGLVFTVFYRLATFTDDPWKSGIAMAAASSWLFVANVSYGMWQSWWIALAFLLAVLMKFSFYVQSPKGDLRG